MMRALAPVAGTSRHYTRSKSTDALAGVRMHRRASSMAIKSDRLASGDMEPAL
jgi:hypothetical protein